MCFLLGTHKPGPRVLLVVLRYIRMQLDSGQAGPCGWLERAATDSHRTTASPRHLGACGGWAGAGTPGDPGSPRGMDRSRAPWGCRLGDASPAPASSRAALDCFPRRYLSLKLIFFFQFGDRNKSPRKDFCESQTQPQPGHFTAFVTKYLPCGPSAKLPKRCFL